MFDELFETLKTGFVLGLIIVSIVIAVAAYKGYQETKERLEREDREKRERQRKRRADIDRIKAASRRWSPEYKKQFPSYLKKCWYADVELYKLLYGNEYKYFFRRCFAAMVDINIDGNIERFYLDWEAVCELEAYIRDIHE